MKLALYLGNVAIVSFFILVSYLLFSLGPVAKSSVPQSFQVKKGDGLNEIAINLKTAGLIRSIGAFKIYAILSGSAYSLKPADYQLDAVSNTPKIIRQLFAGEEGETVLIIEGMTLKDVEKVLADSQILPLGALSAFNFGNLKKDYEFLASVKTLEGYLFPDTYQFFKNSDPEIVIRKFLNNFSKKAWPTLKNSQLLITNYQLLTLASLIEKEVPFIEDKHLVSGVLLERLNQGIALRVDATIIYAKCGGKFVFCDNPSLKRSDLQLNSLYNTYLHPGLPPAPISNPGLASIIAAANPKKSDYFYYLSDPKTKRTIFSKTLEEHNENRAKYLGL